MKSQEDIILAALQENTEGLHPTYLIQDLHVYQYNRAIHNLRERFNCSHKNGNTICFASEHIANKKLPDGTTVFKYSTTRKPWDKDKEPSKKQETSLFDGL